MPAHTEVPLVLVALELGPGEGRDERLKILETVLPKVCRKKGIAVQFVFKQTTIYHALPPRSASTYARELTTKASGCLRDQPAACLCFFIAFCDIGIGETLNASTEIPMVAIVDRLGTLDIVPGLPRDGGLSPDILHIYQTLEDTLGEKIPRTPPVDVAFIAVWLVQAWHVFDKELGNRRIPGNHVH